MSGDHSVPSQATTETDPSVSHGGLPPVERMESDSPALDECKSMTDLIHLMLDDIGDGPEPLQLVPEELQPMLERIQRMAEQNQMGLDPADPLRVADQYVQYPRFGELGAHGYQPAQYYGQAQTDSGPYHYHGHPDDMQYNEVYQTISELCQIMTPASCHEQSQGMPGYRAAGVQADVPLMYQPSTSYGSYEYNPSYGHMSHVHMPYESMQITPPAAQPTSTPTLRELLSPPTSNTSPMQYLELSQPKGESPSPSNTGGVTRARRSFADQDDPDCWMNQI